ncbi:MAG: N-acetylmuramoyl-L-alanine amidase [Desulfobacterales bacterium]|nr:N-acetylmuramoyl-L-alanine amidase [Desulfobacterales bacterium]
MTEGYRSILFKIHTVILLGVFLLAPCAIERAAAGPSTDSIQKRIIVLDPGHGGYDNGAKGSEATLEKTAALEFARVLAEALKNSYEVVLTRTDDYRVDLLTRTATANHINADLFISIHTGGSFLHQAGGISMYYYEKASTSAFGSEPDAMETLKRGTLQTPWSDIQNKHRDASKTLAEFIMSRINQTPEFKADIQGAPLMVLEGADMPAVLIEIGYITNPVDEKNLNDISWMTDASSRIKSGIDDFFEKRQ